jgi:REP element-mobilizing transposase RayT
MARRVSAVRRSWTEVWAGRLMPNPVHFIMAPSSEDGLRQTFAEAHRRHTVRINTRFRRTGQLWHVRFIGAIISEHHVIACAGRSVMDRGRAGNDDKPVELAYVQA